MFWDHNLREESYSFIKVLVSMPLGWAGQRHVWGSDVRVRTWVSILFFFPALILKTGLLLVEAGMLNPSVRQLSFPHCGDSDCNSKELYSLKGNITETPGQRQS